MQGALACAQTRSGLRVSALLPLLITWNIVFRRIPMGFVCPGVSRAWFQHPQKMELREEAGLVRGCGESSRQSQRGHVAFAPCSGLFPPQGIQQTMSHMPPSYHASAPSTFSGKVRIGHSSPCEESHVHSVLPPLSKQTSSSPALPGCKPLSRASAVGGKLTRPPPAYFK